MNWYIDFSADSLKFIKKNNFDEDIVLDKIKLALRQFQGENINVDIKKLSGKWDGFYRIRAGRLRIIIEFQFEQIRYLLEKLTGEEMLINKIGRKIKSEYE